jgi:hypothetical protein
VKTIIMASESFGHVSSRKSHLPKPHFRVVKIVTAFIMPVVDSGFQLPFPTSPTFVSHAQSSETLVRRSFRAVLAITARATVSGVSYVCKKPLIRIRRRISDVPFHLWWLCCYCASTDPDCSGSPSQIPSLSSALHPGLRSRSRISLSCTHS